MSLLKNQGIILLFFCFCFTACRDSDPDVITYQITFDSLERNYIVYNPYPDQLNLPLVFVLHGYGGSNEDVMMYTKMNDVAKEHHFAVCYPQGSADYNGFIHWNSLLNLGDAKDAEFIEYLAQELTNDVAYDASKTYLCGHSNGGFMAYHLARRDLGIFKAFASVCGTISGADWDSLNTMLNANFLQISGTADNVIPMDGTIQLYGDWGGAPSIDSVYIQIGQLANCTAKDTIQCNSNTTEFRFGTCQDQFVYQLTVIDNWGHGWPLSTLKSKDIHASRYIWQFFNN